MIDKGDLQIYVERGNTWIVINAFAKRINLYRIIVALGLVIASVLVLVFPVKMIGASPWAYYYGIRNFSEGNLAVDDQQHTAQVNDARDQGGRLLQYVKIGKDQWALEKAPGYVFYLVPFEWIGIPRWGNILLALGMVIVTFIILKRLRDEKTACIGSLLILFTPVTLIMLNLTYMDTFASLAFLVMGGGLYIYYHLERDTVNPVIGGVLLFLGFFLISWSVVTRYTNFPVAVVFAIHYFITRLILWWKHESINLRLEAFSVVLGVGLPLGVLLLYDYIVFGSPLDYGYNYTRFPIKFAFDYLGQVNRSGQSIPLQIILDNLKSAPKALLWGFPILVVGIPGFCVVLYQKISQLLKRFSTTGRWGSIGTEISWDIFLILVGWFISVFFLYLTYEFTAEYLNEGSPLIRFARFYLPGLFPVVIICALVITRFSFRLYIPILAIVVIAGSLIYIHYVSEDTATTGSRPASETPGIRQQNGESPVRYSTDNGSSVPNLPSGSRRDR